MLIKIPRGWEISEREAAPEQIYLNRRRFIKALGLAGAATLLRRDRLAAAAFGDTKSIYPAKRNEKFVLDRPLTEEWVTAHYNNFYEFTTDKERVADLVEKFQTRPWTVEVTGLVAKPKTYDVDKLIRLMPIEERLYRFRCVEAWSMAVPWTGFPMKAFIDWAQPLSSAKYIRLSRSN